MSEYFSLGYIVGYCGVLLGIGVPIPQLRKILKTKRANDVSLGTYILLCGALICYLIHAIYISAPVFIVAQSINLTTNSIILILLVRGRYGVREKP